MVNRDSGCCWWEVDETKRLVLEKEKDGPTNSGGRIVIQDGSKDMAVVLVDNLEKVVDKAVEVLRSRLSIYFRALVEQTTMETIMSDRCYESGGKEGMGNGDRSPRTQACQHCLKTKNVCPIYRLVADELDSRQTDEAIPFSRSSVADNNPRPRNSRGQRARPKSRKIKCFKCKELGHIAKHCPDRAVSRVGDEDHSGLGEYADSYTMAEVDRNPDEMFVGNVQNDGLRESAGEEADTELEEYDGMTTVPEIDNEIVEAMQ